MPSPSEIQSMLPLFLQLLFFAVAGALIVGTFSAIVGLMVKYALFILLAIIIIVGINYGFIDLSQLFPNSQSWTWGDLENHIIQPPQEPTQ